MFRKEFLKEFLQKNGGGVNEEWTELCNRFSGRIAVFADEEIAALKMPEKFSLGQMIAPR